MTKIYEEEEEGVQTNKCKKIQKQTIKYWEERSKFVQLANFELSVSIEFRTEKFSVKTTNLERH